MDREWLVAGTAGRTIFKKQNHGRAHAFPWFILTFLKQIFNYYLSRFLSFN